MKCQIKIIEIDNDNNSYNLKIGKSCYCEYLGYVTEYPMMTSYGISTEIKHYKSVRLCSRVQKLNLQILRLNK